MFALDAMCGMPAGLTRRRFGVPLLTALLWAVAARPAVAQSPDDLFGRWKVVRIVDEQGKPDADSEDIVALSFTCDGLLKIERTPQANGAYPDAPVQASYRVEGDRIFFVVDGESEYGSFRFAGSELIVFDRQRRITAYLRRPTK